MKLFNRKASHNDQPKTDTVHPVPAHKQKPDKHEQQVIAAISLALHMHLREMKEFENTFITIQKAIKPYSPWSSKIYGLRQRPVCFHSQSSRKK